jgi:hypothetical protein
VTGLVIGIAVLVVVGVLVVVQNVRMRRQGYAIPGETVVRCAKGHLFTTRWIEGGSLKAVRLGATTRYQYCPRCRRFAIVHPLKEAALTDAMRAEAVAAHERSAGPGSATG